MSTRSEQLAAWIRQRVAIAGAQGIAVGLERRHRLRGRRPLAQLATDGQVIGVIMPCHSDPQDEADARLVADHFSMPTARDGPRAPLRSAVVESLTNTVAAAVPGRREGGG